MTIMTAQTALTDSYERRFTYLRLSVTDQCNFRCNYCLPDGYCVDDLEGKFAPLSLDEIRSAVAAFAKAGTEKIRITGGEPTLRKDLPEIIRICKSTPGIKTVALTTNGYRLTKQIDELIDSGLDAINISMDSLRADMFHLITGHNKLQEVQNAIAMAHKRNFFKIKLNAVLMREFNLQELDQFLNYIKATPITLRFIELMQTGDNQEFFAKQHVSGEDIQQQLLEQGWVPVIRDQHAGPAKEFTHPDYQGKLGLIMPYSKDFCRDCNRMRLSSTGNIHTCLFAEEGQSIRPSLLTNSTESIVDEIQQIVFGKTAGHDLHNKQTGATKHLAMLGG